MNNMYNFEKRALVPLKTGHLNMGESNPKGERIDTTNLYLTKNGMPYTPVMGEVHISRLPCEEWEDRILKIKAIGVDTIASYVFWINHEFEEGKLDFTGENNIGEFIGLCQKHGLNFCLRLGPYVNAEYRNGGFPDWLFKSGITLRENNEEYLFYVRRYFTAIYENVKPYLYKNGGNITMIQLENEMVRNPEHILKLKEICLEIGISAPIYTATGWNLIGGAILPKKDVIPMFGGYCAKPWASTIEKIKLSVHFNFSHVRNSAEIGNDLIKPGEYEVHIDLNDYPNAWCELGTGICVGRHRRPYISGIDDYTLAISKLGSGSNLNGYYLICGGINKMLNGVPLCKNHDNEENSLIYPIFNNFFQSPIGEHGAYKQDSYHLMKIVNLFIHDFGQELAEMQPILQESVPHDTNSRELRYAMRTNGESGYIFVNHHSHLLELEPVYGVRFNVNDKMPPIPEEPIDVTGDHAFFFPFNMKYGDACADYITAQPVCKSGNTYFFKEIEGVEPRYKFSGEEELTAELGREKGFERGGVKFITLTEDEARHIFKLDGKVYITDNCDIVSDMGEIKLAGFGSGRYFEYDGDSFTERTVGEEVELARITAEEIDEPDIDKTYQYELFENLHLYGETVWKFDPYMVDRKVKYWALSVSSPVGYVHIDFSGDTAQLYYDGVMCDDCFYNGMEWIVPAKHLYGREVVLAVSEYTHDIYVDVKPKTDLSLDRIYVDKV